MSTRFSCCLLLVVIAAALCGCGGYVASSAQRVPDGRLPAVLLVGDSISLGYTPFVQQALAGSYDVVHPAVNCQSSAFGVAHVREWLGETPWAVVHFNFGLWDIKLGPAGRPTVPLEDYLANLHQFVQVARDVCPGARLVWASTTPVPDVPVTPMLYASDAVRYNAAAAALMLELGVEVDDLYSQELPFVGVDRLPANVHYTDAGSARLASFVVASLR